MSEAEVLVGAKTQTPNNADPDLPDASDFAEHLRFIHFAIISFCLVVAFALPIIDQSKIHRARLQAREIMGLEPVFKDRGNIVDDGSLQGMETNQKWLRDMVSQTNGAMLPRGTLSLEVRDQQTGAGLDLTIAEQFRWFVHLGGHDHHEFKGLLGQLTVDEWAKFWNGLQGAELEFLPDIGGLEVRGHVASDHTKEGEQKSGWRSLNVAPWNASKNISRAGGFLTDDPYTAQDPDDYGTGYATTGDSAYSSWPFIGTDRSLAAEDPEYAIDGVKANAKRITIDVQQMLAAKAFAKWPGGNFEKSFPDFAEETKANRNVRLSELPDELARREESASEVLTVIGLELKAGGLGLSGSVLLLALQLYFLVNLVVFGARLTPFDKAWQFPWILLYKTPLSYAVCLATLFVMPVLLGTWLLPRTVMASCSSGDLLCGVGNYAFAATTLITSILTFLQIHRKFRPMKNWGHHSK